MKRIAILLALILAPALSFAQTNVIQNEAGTTYLPSGGQINSNIAVDRALRGLVSIASGTNGPLSVIPVSNATSLNGVGAGTIAWGQVNTDTAETGTTTTVINATAHNARVGDIIWINSGTAARQWSPVSAVAANTITLSNALTAAPANGDQFYIQRPFPIASTNNANSSGQALSTFLDSSYQQSAATGILKLEDSAHTSGDAGVAALGVYQATLAASAADADYGNLKLNTLGAMYSAPVPSSSSDGSNSQTGYGSSYISTASTNATLASGNILHWITACNTTAANKYVKIYNSGLPTCGSGTPVMRLVVPPNNCVSPNLSIYGVRMASGIGFCITGGATDADTTNTAAADVYLTMGTR